MFSTAAGVYVLKAPLALTVHIRELCIIYGLSSLLF